MSITSIAKHSKFLPIEIVAAFAELNVVNPAAVESEGVASAAIGESHTYLVIVVEFPVKAMACLMILGLSGGVPLWTDAVIASSSWFAFGCSSILSVSLSDVLEEEVSSEMAILKSSFVVECEAANALSHLYVSVRRVGFRGIQGLRLSIFPEHMRGLVIVPESFDC